MRFLLPFFTVVLAFQMDLARALCHCPPSLASSSSESPLHCILNSRNDRDIVFRGKVIRDVSQTSHDGEQSGMQAYLVQVERVIKGCSGSIKVLDRVLVASHIDHDQCGIAPFAVNSSHVFTSNSLQPVDASTRAQLGNRSKAKHFIWVDSCGINQEWDTLSLADKSVIKDYEPSCNEVLQRR